MSESKQGIFPWNNDKPDVKLEKKVEPFGIGKCYYLDASANSHQIYVGKVKSMTDDYLRLENMSWVKSRGDLEKFFEVKSFDKLQQNTSPPEYVYIGDGCVKKNEIVFFTPWPEPELPTRKKK